MADTITWTGKSGKGYQYWIYPIDTTFTSTAGNYVFAKETQPGRFQPIYIGETADLGERFQGHHKMPCIVRNGATHIHVHSNPDQRTRLLEEQDLVDNYQPTCNG